MKRILLLFVVLVATLSGILYWQLREMRLRGERPSGGSATVDGTEVDIVSRLSARIEKIFVNAGDAVKEGQVLVALDCKEPKTMLSEADAAVRGAHVNLRIARVSWALSLEGIETAKSQESAANASVRASAAQQQALLVQLQISQRDNDRTRRLRISGSVSEQTYDQSQSHLAGLQQQQRAAVESTNAARAQLVVAQKAIATAKIQAQLARAKIQAAQEQYSVAKAARNRAAIAVGECTLKAPRQGYVLSRNNEPGEMALPGSRILTISDIREVKAIFYLPNAELAAAKPGRKVKVKADAYANKVFQGHILRVGVVAEFTPRNVQTREDRDRLVYAVEVVVPNPKELLRPGMPVEITILGTGRGH